MSAQWRFEASFAASRRGCHSDFLGRSVDAESSASVLITAPQNSCLNLRYFADNIGEFQFVPQGAGIHHRRNHGFNPAPSHAGKADCVRRMRSLSVLRSIFCFGGMSRKSWDVVTGGSARPDEED